MGYAKFPKMSPSHREEAPLHPKNSPSNLRRKKKTCENKPTGLQFVVALKEIYDFSDSKSLMYVNVGPIFTMLRASFAFHIILSLNYEQGLCISLLSELAETANKTLFSL